MTMNVSSNIIHPAPVSLPEVAAGQEGTVAAAAAGTLNRRAVTVADGTQGKLAQANASSHRESFASKLGAAVGYVVSLPASLFNAVTSTLLSLFDGAINNFTPKESRPSDDMRDMELARLDAQFAQNQRNIAPTPPHASGGLDAAKLSAKEQALMDALAHGTDHQNPAVQPTGGGPGTSRLSAKEQALVDLLAHGTGK